MFSNDNINIYYVFSQSMDTQRIVFNDNYLDFLKVFCLKKMRIADLISPVFSVKSALNPPTQTLS
jgi:hypothetical protein